MAREVEEFCSICQQTRKMPVVQEDGDGDGLPWVQCPECQEIKPLDTGREAGFEDPVRGRLKKSLASARNAEREEGAAPAAPGTVKTYAPGESFAAGDLLYHQVWQDTGKVVGLKESGSGERILVVEFEKVGKKKLLQQRPGGK